jgi:GntR family transcriptional regulator
LEDLGHELARLEEDVSARMPLPDEVASLRLGRGVPVLELIHTSFDQHGQAFEVTQSILPADRNLLTYDLPVS